jgi:hypothetical protein
MTAAVLIDPTPQELAARFDAAMGSPGRAWDQVVAVLNARGEGVATITPEAGLSFSGFGVCWWRDRLGRRHWICRENVQLQGHFGTGLNVGDWIVWLLPNRHPLEWIAPPLSCGWRELEGQREFVVVCRCGVAGTPESIGWMGQTCGPCFDREQEGLPPAGVGPHLPAFSGLDVLGLTEDGAVLTRSAGLPGEMTFRRYAGIDATEPAWERVGLRPTWRCALGRDYLALADRSVITLLDLTDGQSRHTLTVDSSHLRDVTFAGPDRRTLIAVDDDYLYLWGEEPPRLLSAASSASDAAEVLPDPTGRYVLLFEDEGVTVRDPTTGAVLTRLALPTDALTLRATWLPDRRVAIAYRAGDFCTLARWSPLPATAAAGLLSWLFAPAPLPPEVRVTLPDLPRWLAVAPDGTFLVGSTTAIFLRDPTTLKVRASFGLANAEFTNRPELTADGRMIVSTAHGVAVWPWRELFAVE